MPDEREDLKRVARYIIRNPLSTEKMEFKPPNAVNRDGTVIYRSGMNPKIHRNFQIFTPFDFIAAITQHIPDKSFQLVRYYGWYSKKPTGGRRAARSRGNGAKWSGNMRGQRKKRAEEEVEDLEGGVEVIDVSKHQPRRIPSKKCRDLIKKVWEADPLICPDCQREMRIVSLIDEREVIEKILKCLGLWQEGVRVDPQRQTGTDPPPGDWVYEPVDQDPFPDYDTEPALFYATA